MTNLPKIITLIMSFVLFSCQSVPVTLEAIGGSKADGTVDLAYQFNGFMKQDIQWGKAHDTAVARCKFWGYNEAERFGGEKIVTCTEYWGGGCISGQKSIAFQCINR